MTKIAELRHVPKKGKWMAFWGDQMLCQSQNRERVIMLIREGLCAKARRYGITDIGEHVNGAITAAKSAVVPATRVLLAPETNETPIIQLPAKPQFTVKERFEFLADYTDMLINREIVSLMVSGSAGCGKTHTVQERFKRANLEIEVIEETVTANSSDGLEDGEDEDTEDDANIDKCVLIKGYSTAKFLYKTLYHHRNGIVIADDADKIIEDKTAITILKAALDSYDRRIVTWGAAGMIDDGLPRSFEFRGGLIVITNKDLRSIDKANRSRSALMDITLNGDEFMDLIEEKMPHMCIDMPITQRREVLEFIRERQSVCTDLNLRTFQLICKIRKSNQNWERLAEYSLTLA